jgi:hypothetical protein
MTVVVGTAHCVWVYIYKFYRTIPSVTGYMSMTFFYTVTNSVSKGRLK